MAAERGIRTTTPDDMEINDPQSALNQYFREEARYWTEIYSREGVNETIHQDRLHAALQMAENLGLRSGSRVLDVGCGAGFATIALAARGLHVDAVDPVPSMLEAVCARAEKAGVDSRVMTQVGDIRAMPFPDATFDLVVALGVLPWLPRIVEALQEMSRVLRPGGHIIVTVDTRWQLRQAFDPFLSPLLAVPRRWAARALRRPSSGVRAATTSIRDFRHALARQGFSEVKGMAVGFGPFTVFKRAVLPATLGLNLHRGLQFLASRGAPLLRSGGSQYLVLARKDGLRGQAAETSP